MPHVFSEAEHQQISTLFQLALEEDCVAADLTSRAIFADEHESSMQLTAREDMVFAGASVLPILLQVAKQTAEMQGSLYIKLAAADGAKLTKGAPIGSISGKTLNILAHERVILNMLQRLCGVATLTRTYVDAVKHTRARLLDTRKTIPGWRALDKYAVVCGGGLNHRMNLADMVMIKDNHIAAANGIENAIKKVLHYREEGIPVVVECDTLAQLNLCLQYPIDRILLDNMPVDMLRQAVVIVAGRVPLEASGGVTLETIRDIAETGVDFISVGSITHAARAVDIGLDKI